MYRTNFLPTREADLDVWVKNFVGKLPQYATALGISTAEINALIAQSAMLTYTITQIEWLKTELAKRIAYKHILLDSKLGSTISAFPSFTVPAVAPATVTAGFIEAIIYMVTRIKAMPNYTESTGQDLGIVPGKSNSAMKTTLKPDLRISFEAAQPVLKWTKGNMTGVDIYVNRNDGKGFVLLYGSNKSKYKDMSKLPAALTTWVYKIIYRQGDKQVGEFSDPVSIAVIDNLPTETSSLS